MLFCSVVQVELWENMASSACRIHWFVSFFAFFGQTLASSVLTVPTVKREFTRKINHWVTFMSYL